MRYFAAHNQTRLAVSKTFNRENTIAYSIVRPERIAYRIVTNTGSSRARPTEWDQQMYQQCVQYSPITR